MKLTLPFLSSRFAALPKSQDKNLNILRTKRGFEVKWQAFFIIFKGLSAAKNCLRPESVPLMQRDFCMFYIFYETQPFIVPDSFRLFSLILNFLIIELLN